MTPPSPDRPDSEGLFPWRFFVRALACTVRVRVLALALVGTSVGTLLLPPQAPVEASRLEASLDLATALPGPINHWRAVVGTVVHPFLLGGAARWPAAAAAVGMLVWWSLVGGAIARIAAAQLTFRAPPAMFAAMAGSARLLGVRCLPVVGVGLAAAALLLPLWLHGWLMHLPLLDFVSALLLPIPLILAAVAAVILVLLTLNWPLLIACPAVERTDSFDAASRAFAYVTQRPIRLVAYLVTAVLVAAPVGLVVAAATLLLERFTGLLLPTPSEEPGIADSVAAFWLRTVAMQLPAVFYAAYAWCAAVAIYLLLRRDIDGVQVDELETASRA
ncbi:hypothetical protein KOR34_24900 [Posidoniimonas corsicana]|uniref:Uncharacterized protein n=1 Tax=Posidoniimonas corsicana TaxID=1938618 RepID=A0A5C5VHS5_9BACT|nr:hypothetical protein [Posidoniimonas corsicana]TWT37537.1 hypothetical protein KOR34_24900 [Posidoniimonas corsicana]